MPRFRKQLAHRHRLRMSEMGKASQRVKRAKREEGLADRLRELAEIEATNLPRKQGDALGSLQWTNFATGKVNRWIIRIGDRADRITMHSPDGRSTQSHGWTWILNKLRSHLTK
jgi:hypothetical protein